MRTLTVILIVFCLSKAHAQTQIGLKQGLDLNYITRFPDLTEYQATPVIGSASGFLLNYNLNERFVFVTGLDFTFKNFTVSNKNYEQRIYQTYINSFLQLPVKIQLYFPYKRIKGFLNAGGFSSYWLRSKVKGTMPDLYNATLNKKFNEVIPLIGYKQIHRFRDNRENRIQAGGVIGGGIEYPMKHQYSFFIGLEYQMTFIDSFKTHQQQQFPRRNATFIVALGCLIKL